MTTDYPDLHQCVWWLRKLLCDVSRFKSIRQLNYVLWKLTGVEFKWDCNAYVAFHEAWPQVLARFRQIPADDLPSFVERRIDCHYQLEPFFPAAVRHIGTPAVAAQAATLH